MTRWTEIEAGMGEMQLDGSLKYRVSLGSSEELGLLGIHLNMEHIITTDENGGARSAWRFAGLQTSFVPMGRRLLRWKSPTGLMVDFEKAKIGPAFSRAAGEGAVQWLIRKTSENGYEIHSPEGVSWHYEYGRLARIEHPALGVLRVSTQGAWITRIERSGVADRGGVLLDASYSDDGRLLRLRLCGQAEQAFTWSGSELVAWRNAAGEYVRWSYADGLLAQISEPRQAVREICWRTNKGFGRGDSRWPLPVHLAAIDGECYDYQLTSRGFVLTRKMGSEGGAPIVKTRFNPLRYRLEQWAGEDAFIVIFRSHSPGRGAVERIATVSGDVLEEYRYDKVGRLIGVRMQGERPLDFTYDDLGRLIEVEGEFGQ